MRKTLAKIIRWAMRDIEPQEDLMKANVNMAYGTLSGNVVAEGDDDSINFYLSSAVGGKILRVHKTDRKTDRSSGSTYVIPSGEDVGERVTKIVNMELMR